MTKDKKKNDDLWKGARDGTKGGGFTPFLFFVLSASFRDRLFFLLDLGMTFYPSRVLSGLVSSFFHGGASSWFRVSFLVFACVVVCCGDGLGVRSGGAFCLRGFPLWLGLRGLGSVPVPVGVGPGAWSLDVPFALVRGLRCVRLTRDLRGGVGMAWVRRRCSIG